MTAFLCANFFKGVYAAQFDNCLNFGLSSEKDSYGRQSHWATEGKWCNHASEHGFGVYSQKCQLQASFGESFHQWQSSGLQSFLESSIIVGCSVASISDLVAGWLTVVYSVGHFSIEDNSIVSCSTEIYPIMSYSIGNCSMARSL